MGRPSHRQFLTSFHGADTTYNRILFFTDYSYLHLILCIKPLQKGNNILVDTSLCHPERSEGSVYIYKCVYRFFVTSFLKMTRCVN